MESGLSFCKRPFHVSLSDSSSQKQFCLRVMRLHNSYVRQQYYVGLFSVHLQLLLYIQKI
jgi:hypothetical protein